MTDSSTPSTLVVVGASLAGAKAAEAAREAGHDGPIVLIGDETGVPYERPPLSKAVLRGEAELEVTHVHPEAFYAAAFACAGSSAASFSSRMRFPSSPPGWPGAGSSIRRRGSISSSMRRA